MPIISTKVKKHIPIWCMYQLEWLHFKWKVNLCENVLFHSPVMNNVEFHNATVIDIRLCLLNLHNVCQCIFNILYAKSTDTWFGLVEKCDSHSVCNIGAICAMYTCTMSIVNGFGYG